MPSYVVIKQGFVYKGREYKIGETWDTDEAPEKIIPYQEWLPRGCIYLAVNKDSNVMAIGQVKGDKTPEKRMADSDYNGAKALSGKWRVAWFFLTDELDGAELMLISHIARTGIKQITKSGTFQYDDRTEQEFKQIPQKIQCSNLHWIIDEKELFTAYMFR